MRATVAFPMRDDTLPHQIHLALVGRDIGISCTCLARDKKNGRRAFLATRRLVEAAEAMEIWRAHLPAGAP